MPAFSLTKGIGRFEEEASFVTEDVQRYDESSTNGGRKRPLKMKKSGGFQHITVSFASFCLL